MEGTMQVAYPELITESVEDLAALERAVRGTAAADRLKLLRWLKSGQEPSVHHAASRLGYSVRCAQRWWACYRDGGVAAVFPKPRHRPGERMSADAWAGLEEEMRAGHLGRLKEVQAYLRERWNIPYSLDGVSKLFQRHKVKLKTGRRRHRRAADPATQATFKKGASGHGRRSDNEPGICV
jgi:transposase